VEALAQSLKEGEVDYAVVDMYLPLLRKDVFNGSWFEAAALLSGDMYHGVVLQGDALNLASALEEMIAIDNLQTKFLEDNQEKEVSFRLVAFFDFRKFHHYRVFYTMNQVFQAMSPYIAN